MWHAFSVLFRVGLPWGCACGATPGWYVVPIQGTPPLRDRLTPQRHMTPQTACKHARNIAVTNG
jgi:hypothetical protein